MLARVLIAILLTTFAGNLTAATFTVTASSGTGPGSLPQAILDANATPGRDQIRFAVAMVTVTGGFRPIPEITDPVDIEGPVRIAPGPATDIERGFVFRSGSNGSTLRNVAISGFVEAVFINASHITVERLRVLSLSVVRILAGNDNLVQDSTLGVIVRIHGARNTFLRNAETSYDLSLAPETRIGSAGNGNAIVTLGIANSPGTIIEGNTFAPATFTNPLEAITIRGGTAVNVTVAGNTIHTYPTGVAIPGGTFAATGVQITGNSIYDVGIAIDLDANGATPNDPAPDADTGANNLQNYPVLTAATLAGGSLTVSGTLTSTPLNTYEIELFADEASDPEPRTPLASFQVTTDATGTATFTRTITSPLPTGDEVVLSTATNIATEDTSEVSAPVAIAAPGTLGFGSATYTVNESDGTVTIVADRIGGAEGTVTVQYATQDGTAIAPTDYTTTSGTLTFAPGVTTQSFTVPIVADSLPEPGETFTVNLSGATGGAAIGTATATITITAHLPSAPSDIPTASTWALIALLVGMVVIAVIRL